MRRRTAPGNVRVHRPQGVDMGTLPAWAAWNTVGAERPWTVGIEEEAFLVHPPRWAPANRVADVLAALPPPLAGHVGAETHACVVELATAPHDTVAAAVAELAGLRGELTRVLRGLQLRAAVAGCHPTASWQEVQVTQGARQRAVHAATRELARREPTCGLHVHVAVPDGDTGARALAGIRQDLPMLLALSANSPFWQGRDTGLASTRIPVFSMFPRVGIPRRLPTYPEYVRGIDALVGPGAVPDPSHVWWDARLRPDLGTVEVRIMDAQSQIAGSAALAALVQCLVRLHATSGRRTRELSPEALDENRFIACRDGIAACLIEAGRPRLAPAVRRLGATLADCAPIARQLGCDAELAAVPALAAAPGHARQRAVGHRLGLIAATGWLVREYDAGMAGTTRRTDVGVIAAPPARAGR
jgi:carboxylate-amine ligase